VDDGYEADSLHKRSRSLLNYIIAAIKSPLVEPVDIESPQFSCPLLWKQNLVLCMYILNQHLSRSSEEQSIMTISTSTNFCHLCTNSIRNPYQVLCHPAFVLSIAVLPGPKQTRALDTAYRCLRGIRFICLGLSFRHSTMAAIRRFSCAFSAKTKISPIDFLSLKVWVS